MVDHHLTINQLEGQGCKADYLHLIELRYMPIVMRPEASTRLKKIGRIMDRRWFRFHMAHVRNVRIAISHQSIQLGKKGTKIDYSQMQQVQDPILLTEK